MEVFGVIEGICPVGGIKTPVTGNLFRRNRLVETTNVELVFISFHAEVVLGFDHNVVTSKEYIIQIGDVTGIHSEKQSKYFWNISR
jgi:hypothetical protein